MGNDTEDAVDRSELEDLRRRAEARLREQLPSDESWETMSPADVARLVHELRTHQIELELQNEQLLLTQVALHKARDRYADLFDHAPVGYLALSEDLLITEANATGARLLGRSRVDLVNDRLHDHIDPASQDQFHLCYRRLLTTGDRQICEVTMSRGGDGSFIARLEMQPADTRDDRDMRVALSDVTDQRRTEEELHRLHNLRSLGLLAGGIAHDFNNALTGATTNLSLLMKQLPEEGEHRVLVEEALAATARSRQLARQLLTFSSGGAPSREQVSIKQLVRDWTQQSLVGSNLKPDYLFSPDLADVEVDPDQIGQVIQNLVINAAQATPHASSLHISATNTTISTGDPVPLSPGDYVKVTVRDHGVGIPDNIREQIFDPYFTTKPSGHGVGLAICHSIVERHRGHISASSSQTGSAFTFYLPATANPSPQPAPAVPETAEVSLPAGVKRVLVMDDEEGIRVAVVRGLALSGCEVVAVSDGDEAIHAYAQALSAEARFDVVILDITIPGGMGGKVAIEHLRRLDPTVRAVVCSGYSDDPVMADPPAFGFSASLAKPMTLEELVSGVREAYLRADPI